MAVFVAFESVVLGFAVGIYLIKTEIHPVIGILVGFGVFVLWIYLFTVRGVATVMNALVAVAWGAGIGYWTWWGGNDWLWVAFATVVPAAISWFGHWGFIQGIQWAKQQNP